MAKIKFSFDLEMAKYLAQLRAVCFNNLLRGADGVQQAQVWFEVCDDETINVLAAFGGFPSRYEHYRFAMDYLELSKGYTYGLSKIYEMVINNDPVYAYLLEDNSLVDQKLVMSHVYGHADFFFNNIYFQKTNRRALEMMANHALLVVQIKEKMTDANKNDNVEQWIDTCLSLEDLIDRNAPGIKRAADERTFLLEEKKAQHEHWSGRFKARGYMDKFVNPDEETARYQEWLVQEKEEQVRRDNKIAFPPEPVADVFKFLIDHSPLENWQREIAQAIWEEAVYFIPQGQTKIMNEGWASYWHSKLMTGGGMETAEVVDFADHHSGTVAQHPMGRLNPYKLGLEIFRDIEYRWNTGRHGKIWEECDDSAVLENWDLFAAFKVVSDDCDGDIVQFGRRWHEFLCFWRALKEERCGFPKIYLEEKLLSWWHDYQNLADRFQALKQIEKDVLEYIRCFLGSARQRYRAKDKEKHCRKIKIAKKLWQACRGELKKRARVYEAFANIKAAIENNQLPPADFAIPNGFFQYAQRNKQVEMVVGDGSRKIFEVRKFHCDLTFIDHFLTEPIALKLYLFAYDENESGNLVIESRKFQDVKKKLLDGLTNLGRPQIEVVDANLHNGHELLLRHRYDGRELEPNWAQETLERVHKLWHRPVFVETTTLNEDAEEVKVRLGFTGDEFVKEEVKPEA